jgi:hypothetical protein
MRAMAVSVSLLVCGCAFLARDAAIIEPSVLLSQRNSDVSAAKQKRVRSAPQARPAPGRYGPPDPSIGPDGRPYPVPEYLRGQCYYDDGYGRFSACSNRN